MREAEQVYSPGRTKIVFWGVRLKMDTMPLTSGRLEHLFVVRMWQESTQHKADGWRGSVEHVPSGQRLYFVSFNDLNDFIQLRLYGPSHSAPTPNETEPSI